LGVRYRGGCCSPPDFQAALAVSRPLLRIREPRRQRADPEATTRAVTQSLALSHLAPLASKLHSKMAPRDHIATYILAGGKSSRMGRDKAMLAPGGIPLLMRTAALLAPLAGPPTIIGPPTRYSALGYNVIPDDTPGIGPLGGIATALRHSNQPWNLIVGCDLPFLTSEWLDYLTARAVESKADAMIPESDAGPEPLCAMYRKTCVTAILAAITGGTRKVSDAVAALKIDSVPPRDWKPFDESGRLFKNMNTPEDFEEADAILEDELGGEA
jgi:molybdopterin-guanine dinucleotide biosynthesis protein A